MLGDVWGKRGPTFTIGRITTREIRMENYQKAEVNLQYEAALSFSLAYAQSAQHPTPQRIA